MREIRLPLPFYAYRFNLLLEFVKRIAHPARLVVQGDTLWRFTDGRLLAFRQSGDAIVICGQGLSGEDEARIKRISLHCLGLCRDQSAFYEFAERDDHLWQVVEPLLGMPIFCTETIFEALVTLIIEQHITWKTALRSQRTLLQIFDSGETVGQAPVYDFPSPQQLAGVAQAELKPLKITNRRIDMILEIAKAVVSGELDLESKCNLDPRTAYDQLMEIEGVGPWTANNVIGRALGAYPYVSQNDVALQAAVQHYFRDGEVGKSAELVRDTLNEYGEYAGLAGHFVLLRWVLDRYPPISNKPERVLP